MVTESFLPDPDAAEPPHHALHAAERLYGRSGRQGRATPHAPRRGRDWARVTAWASVVLVGGSLALAAVVWKPAPSVETVLSGAQFELSMGLIEPARKDLDDVLRRDPDNGYAQLLRAWIDERDGDYPSALRRYEKSAAAVLASGDANLISGYYVSTGLLRLATGDFAGAEADAERAIRRGDRAAAGFAIRAYSRLGEGDDRGFRRSISEAYSADPSEPVLRLRRDFLTEAIPWAGAFGVDGDPGVVPGS